jgi:hypothetical protein
MHAYSCTRRSSSLAEAILPSIQTPLTLYVFICLDISSSGLAKLRLSFPCRSIKGPLTDLADTELDPSRKKQLSLALRNTARLARLIDSLMFVVPLSHQRSSC